MSWSEFYIVVSGLITFVLLIVAFPWLRRKNHAQQDSLSNTQIVKQRLAELDREVQEGLISEHDKRQAVDELKLALVDESAFQSKRTGTATLPLLVGGIVALTCGAVVYSQVNQMSRVIKASEAVEALPELSQQLASGNASNLTQQDIASLTLAIRQRLRTQPEDDTGWMYLGRLFLSIGQEVQAIEAIDRAVELAPENTTHRITLAQALMATGDVNNLSRAQTLLLGLLKDNPQNDNLALMMAVVSAQLGDLDNTRQFFAQVKDKLPTDSDMAKRLMARIDVLARQAGEIGVAQVDESTELGSTRLESTDEATAADITGFSVTVDLSDEAQESAPKEGFLIVFAQDGASQNRMPAAVVKMPIQEFPLTVTLTTENAMMPQFTLASLSQVILTARLSLDGDVTVSSGEWQGSVESTVEKGQLSPIRITVNKEL